MGKARLAEVYAKLSDSSRAIQLLQDAQKIFVETGNIAYAQLANEKVKNIRFSNKKQ
jgi:hypothetical protein